MSSSGARRKILVIESDASIRNTLYVLLAGLDCESAIAYNSQQALRMISRDSFDAVLLDLRSSLVPADEMMAQIKQLSPNLVGRVLVITGEVADPKTMELIEEQCLTPIAGNRLMSDLWARLRLLLGLAPPAENRS